MNLECFLSELNIQKPPALPLPPQVTVPPPPVNQDLDSERQGLLQSRAGLRGKTTHPVSSLCSSECCTGVHSSLQGSCVTHLYLVLQSQGQGVIFSGYRLCDGCSLGLTVNVGQQDDHSG